MLAVTDRRGVEAGYRTGCLHPEDGREYRVGITMRYLPLDILWFLYSPDRFRARPSWFRFFGRDLCYQVLSLRDPGPFLAIGLSGLRRLLSPRVRAEKLGRGA